MSKNKKIKIIKKLDAAGRFQATNLVSKSYWAACNAFGLPNPGGISVDWTDKGYPYAMLEFQKVYLSVESAEAIAEEKGIDVRSIVISDVLHETGHIFAFELKNKLPEAYEDLAEAVEAEDRDSPSEAIADAFVGIVLALSEEDPDGLEDFEEVAELAAPGVVRPLVIPRPRFMSELAAANDAVGCLPGKFNPCREHQSGPVRALNLGIGYQFGKSLLQPFEEEDDDAQEEFGSPWEWEAA